MKASLLIVMIVAPLLISVGRQTNGTPGAGYTWSLGDLSADLSTRVDTDWDYSAWADGYDTEAELNALGWETVTVDGITDADGFTDTINCAAGGAGSEEDETDFQALLVAACDSEPSGNTPGVCGKVFKIAASCTVDVHAGEGDAINGDDALSLNYSNIAIIGEDPDTSIIYSNNQVSANTEMVAPLFGTGVSWGYSGGVDGATYTRGSGSITKGTSVLSLTSCSNLDTGDLVRINGTDEDGASLPYQTEVTMSGCDATLSDPLPTTFASIPNITEEGGVGPRNRIFMNFTIGFPFLPDGIGTNASDASNAIIFRDRAARRTLWQDMKMGPFGQSWMHTFGSHQNVVRHNTIGPGLHTMRRQNNGPAVMPPNTFGSLTSIYDNTFLRGAVRIWVNDDASNFIYAGFNYQVDQLPTNPVEGGNYCSGITNPQGFPNISSGPERSIFINHDPASTNMGRMLFESNDFKCNILRESLNPILRYVTFYRNRVIGQNSTVQFNGGSSEAYMNFVANRVGTFSLLGTSSNFALGRYNIATAATDAPAGTSVDWPTTGTGKNYQDASGAHDDYPVDMPPSLALQTNTAPSWWCTQSGPWDGTWSFGAGDGYLGTTYKLPAQIRYEGTTCTPP